MPSRFIPISPNADVSQQVSLINKNFAELDAEGTIKLYYDKQGIPNISIGIQPDGTSRIRVAKAGIDVTTANDSQLSFNSSQNTLKVVATGLVDLPLSFNVQTGLIENGSDSSVFTITHNLGFIPTVLVYYANTTNGVATDYFPFGYGSIYSQSFGNNYTVVYKSHVSVSSTTILLGLTRDFYVAAGTSTGAFANGSGRFKYILLQESIE